MTTLTQDDLIKRFEKLGAEGVREAFPTFKTKARQRLALDWLAEQADKSEKAKAKTNHIAKVEAEAKLEKDPPKEKDKWAEHSAMKNVKAPDAKSHERSGKSTGKKD